MIVDFPYGENGWGGAKSPPPDRPVSLPAGHSDELQLPDQCPLLTSHISQTHFAKRHRDCFSSTHGRVSLSHPASAPVYTRRFPLPGLAARYLTGCSY